MQKFGIKNAKHLIKLTITSKQKLTSPLIVHFTLYADSNYL